jgi:AraC-like DNA-binding protein
MAASTRLKSPLTFEIARFAEPGFPLFIEKKIQPFAREHRHDAYEFFYVVKGHIQHTLQGRRGRVAEGDLVFLGPTHRHGFTPGAGERPLLINCLFQPELFSLSSMEGPGRRRREASAALPVDSSLFAQTTVLRAIGPDRARLEETLHRLHEECHGKKPGYRPLATALLAYFFGLVNRIRAEAQAEHAAPAHASDIAEKILSVKNHVDAHFLEALSLRTLADQSGLHYTQLSHLFKDFAGCNFRIYLIRSRIEYAKILIRRKDASISRIAAECGFNDLTHFGRCFRQQAGVSPTRYREALSVKPAPVSGEEPVFH